MVAIARPADSPVVIDRRRIELVDSKVPGAAQPYHAAEGLDLKEAEKLVNRSVEEARRRARQALCAVIEDLGKKGYDAVACGILLASGRPATTLAATLASHALIHSAEGELFREALMHASKHCGLPVTGVKERELYDRGSAELGIPIEKLQRQVSELGKSIGPPWRQDEKHAAMVAWLALAAAHL